MEHEGRQAGGEREGEEERKEHGSTWVQTLQGSGKKDTESLSFLYYAGRSLHSKTLLNLFLKCKVKSYYLSSRIYIPTLGNIYSTHSEQLLNGKINIKGIAGW